MSGLWVLLGFFVMVMGGITLVGYAYFLRGSSAGSTNPQLPSGLATQPELPPTRAAFFHFFHSIGENFPSAKKEQNPYRRRLYLAGYRWPSAVSVFYGIKFATMLFLAGAAGVTCLYLRTDLSLAPLAMICGAGIGLVLPDQILKSRVRARAQRLRRGLPAALDMMVLGLEAGQSLDQSIADTSRAMVNTHPELGVEFSQVYLELRASNSRAQAFRNLASRNKEPELRKLASVLVDSDRFGVALSPALRSHNKYLRTRFRQRAQESARKIGIKLIFPVFFLIFPSVLLVTLGPAVIMMFQQLHSLLQ